MLKKTLLSLLLIGVYALTFGQIKSPDEFLGYALGSHFTPHHKVADYFRQVALSATDRVKLIEYGRTNEGRPLMVALVSSAENLQKLETFRLQNIALANAQGNAVKLSEQPVFLWLSYNVHGNEASSTETAMKMLYELVLAKNPDIKNGLKNTVVMIDPCLNPDGRDRYVNYFNSVVGEKPNPDPFSREHIEPWPGGRYNHYYFDLNRDWAWQTQVESEQRVALYNNWMPQVHVDFHEQSYNEPYYFAPAAEPVHQNITPWQRYFQTVVGKNNAKYFDAEGWSYFTRERFDLLYPSYGDTYPLYNGAIGMTYEQGGIRAGLSVVTLNGDTLTLKDRIAHHFATGLSTLETTSLHHTELLQAYKEYFKKSVSVSPGIYKGFVVKADNVSRLKKLAALLTKNKIAFAFGGEKKVKGYNYETQREETFTIERNDLVVDLRQPRAVLANVLFEPNTFVADSNTYDITAWSLPYAFGLGAFATKEPVKGLYNTLDISISPAVSNPKPVAWMFNWGETEDLDLLIALQNEKIKVRQAKEPFAVNGKDYPAGTLVVLRLENEKNVKYLSDKLLALSQKFNRQVSGATSGLVDKGKDFGSNAYPLLKEPKVAIVAGSEVSAQAVGEVWFFLEKNLGMPVSIISTSDLNRFDFNKVNTLILPDGQYGGLIKEELLTWVHKGGRLILMEDAIESLLEKKGFEIKKKGVVTNKSPEQASARSMQIEKGKNLFANATPGAIYRLNMDVSHPFAYGLGKKYYFLKTDQKVYEPLTNGGNVGWVDEKGFVTGLVGLQAREMLRSGWMLGTQVYGKGQVVYMAFDPLFRNFWESGKVLFGNVIFCNY